MNKSNLYKYLGIILLFNVEITTNAQYLELKGGTTIVTIITNDSIVIAADSRLTDLFNPDAFSITDKIRTRKGCAYAIAGEFLFIKDVHGDTLFNIYGLMDSIIDKY